jgi:hypothetical protein
MKLVLLVLLSSLSAAANAVSISCNDANHTPSISVDVSQGEKEGRGLGSVRASDHGPFGFIACPSIEWAAKNGKPIACAGIFDMDFDPAHHGEKDQSFQTTVRLDFMKTNDDWKVTFNLPVAWGGNSKTITCDVAE